MPIRYEKNFLWTFLAGIALLCFLIALFSEGTYDSGDGIQHYLFSRYSWKHPELFLHHWGKPFFILVSSPFSQFGLKGAIIFNILCALGSGFFCYKIAKKLEISFPVFVIPFLFFAPIYFAVIQSGLTEPFFGFVLILCIYGLTPSPRRVRPLADNPSPKERGISPPQPSKREGASMHMQTLDKPVRNQSPPFRGGWEGLVLFLSAALVSFLPFIRSEGFLILPLFLILLLYRKKFWAIPFLSLGTVIYSVIGYFYYDDLFWIMNQNPYNGNSEIYGNGKIYHFLIREEFTWGTPLFLLFCGGCVWAVFLALTKWNVGMLECWKRCINSNIPSFQHSRINFQAEEFILIYSSFFIYFIAHTLFWWQGLFNSLGLIRVMAAVMPVSAIISLRGLNFIVPLFTKSKKREKIFYALLFSSLILICMFHNKSLLKLNREDVVIRNATDWFKNSEYKTQKIFYLHPYVSLALDLDRFDRSTNGELWGLDSLHPEFQMPSKSIMIWDAHFGPNEGRIKLGALINNNSFVLLNKFVPEKEFTVLGGKKFEVYFFERK